MSVVNVSEVVAKLRERGVAEQDVEAAVASFDLQVFEFTLAQAWDAGFLRPLTSHRGLGLGDRSCLALARELHTTALTADRPWSDLDVGVEIRLIR
jgi:PIN domain nuclease of toxin-antitoxin system